MNLTKSNLVTISENARTAIEGAAILVTGAGGSIGSALSRQLLNLSPRKLILLELSEHDLYLLDLKLRLREQGETVATVLGDIRDKDLLDQIFSVHRPEIVFHAAACKHVVLLERQIHTALSVNLIGTYVVARMANRYCARKVASLSTDKAVN